MSVKIRNAAIKDYESVLRIMNQIQKIHINWRPDIYKENCNIISREAFQKIVEGDNFFVTEIDESIVGIMEVIKRHIETPAHITRNVLFIDSMAVEENYRGQGIGHMFLEKVKEMKEQLHFDGIELQVNAKNKAAYEMYLKFGFTEKSINMELL